MAKTRKDVDCDSLELLLDTMCNTFGGVMFVAIALVVISSLIQKVTVSEENQQVESEEIRNSIAKETDKLKMVQMNRSLKERIVEKYQNNPNIKLIERLAELKDSNQALSTKLREKTLDVDKLATDLLKIQKEIKFTKDELSLLENKIKSLEREISNETELHNKRLDEIEKKKPSTDTVNLSFPRLKEEKGIPFFFAISENRLYRIDEFSNPLEPSNDTPHADSVECIYQKDKNCLKINLLPGKGVSLDNINEIDKILKKIDKRSRFIDLSVANDSFKSFIQFKKRLKDNNFRIRWAPYIDISELSLLFIDKSDYKSQ